MATSKSHDHAKAEMATKLKSELQSLVDAVERVYENLPEYDKCATGPSGTARALSGPLQQRLENVNEFRSASYEVYRQQVNNILPKIDTWAQEQDLRYLDKLLSDCGDMIRNLPAEHMRDQVPLLKEPYKLQAWDAPTVYATIYLKLLELPGAYD